MTPLGTAAGSSVGLPRPTRARGALGRAPAPCGQPRPLVARYFREGTGQGYGGDSTAHGRGPESLPDSAAPARAADTAAVQLPNPQGNVLPYVASTRQHVVHHHHEHLEPGAEPPQHAPAPASAHPSGGTPAGAAEAAEAAAAELFRGQLDLRSSAGTPAHSGTSTASAPTALTSDIQVAAAVAAVLGANHDEAPETEGLDACVDRSTLGARRWRRAPEPLGADEGSLAGAASALRDPMLQAGEGAGLGGAEGDAAAILDALAHQEALEQLQRQGAGTRRGRPPSTVTPQPPTASHPHPQPHAHHEPTHAPAAPAAAPAPATPPGPAARPRSAQGRRDATAPLAHPAVYGNSPDIADEDLEAPQQGEAAAEAGLGEEGLHGGAALAAAARARAQQQLGSTPAAQTAPSAAAAGAGSAAAAGGGARSGKRGRRSLRKGGLRELISQPGVYGNSPDVPDSDLPHGHGHARSRHAPLHGHALPPAGAGAAPGAEGGAAAAAAAAADGAGRRLRSLGDVDRQFIELDSPAGWDEHAKDLMSSMRSTSPKLRSGTTQHHQQEPQGAPPEQQRRRAPGVAVPDPEVSGVHGRATHEGSGAAGQSGGGGGGESSGGSASAAAGGGTVTGSGGGGGGGGGANGIQARPSGVTSQTYGNMARPAAALRAAGVPLTRVSSPSAARVRTAIKVLRSPPPPAPQAPAGTGGADADGSPPDQAPWAAAAALAASTPPSHAPPVHAPASGGAPLGASGMGGGGPAGSWGMEGELVSGRGGTWHSGVQQQQHQQRQPAGPLPAPPCGSGLMSALAHHAPDALTPLPSEEHGDRYHGASAEALEDAMRSGRAGPPGAGRATRGSGSSSSTTMDVSVDEQELLTRRPGLVLGAGEVEPGLVEQDPPFPHGSDAPVLRPGGGGDGGSEDMMLHDPHDPHGSHGVMPVGPGPLASRDSQDYGCPEDYDEVMGQIQDGQRSGWAEDGVAGSSISFRSDVY